MAMIQVTPELLNSRASDVRRLKTEHEQTMQRLNQLILGLNDVWKGQAQDAFVAKYQSMQSTFRNFSEMLEGYATLMDTASRELQNTDQQLKGTMQSFG